MIAGSYGLFRLGIPGIIILVLIGLLQLFRT
jgi:hypothetical protein